MNPLEGAEGMRAVEHIELSIPEADLHLVGQARVEAVHDAIHPAGIDLALVAEIRFQPRGGHPLVLVAALVVAGDAVADGHGLGPDCLHKGQAAGKRACSPPESPVQWAWA